MSIVIEYLLKNKHLMEKLPRETLEELVRLERARIRQMKSGWLPENVSSEMAQAVPTDLIQSIVCDNRKGTSEPGWLPPPKPDYSRVMDPERVNEPEEPKGTGWVTAPSLVDSVPYIRAVDAVAEHFNQMDKCELEAKFKRRI